MNGLMTVTPCMWDHDVPTNILTRFYKIAIQGTPQMAVDKEAIAYRESTHIVTTRRVPVQRAVERDEIPYP